MQTSLCKPCLRFHSDQSQKKTQEEAVSPHTHSSLPSFSMVAFWLHCLRLTHVLHASSHDSFNSAVICAITAFIVLDESKSDDFLITVQISLYVSVLLFGHCSLAFHNRNLWCGLFLFLTSLFSPLLSQCTQSTKDMLERMVHSSDFHGLCPPGAPKTTPLGPEASSPLAPSAESSPSAVCSQQYDHQPMAASCPAFSRSSKRDSLHSINPAFRLASPSPSLSRASLILGDAPDIGFIPLSWVCAQ